MISGDKFDDKRLLSHNITGVCHSRLLSHKLRSMPQKGVFISTFWDEIRHTLGLHSSQGDQFVSYVISAIGFISMMKS